MRRQQQLRQRGLRGVETRATDRLGCDVHRSTDERHKRLRLDENKM